jgi:hypothetical protein
MMRPEVRLLVDGPPDKLSEDISDADLERFQAAILNLQKPATDEEATALVDLMSRCDDSMYGLTWNVAHFVESAPGWPVETLFEREGFWPESLRQAYRNRQLGSQSSE